MLGPGHPGHLRRPRTQRRAGRGHVDPGLGLDRRLLRPAARRPVGRGVRERGDLDVGHPLGRRHIAIQAGDHHPRREAVLHGQRRAVHRDGEQRVPSVQDDLQRRARGEPVGRRAQQLAGAGPRAGLPDQVGQAGAEPLRVAHVGPAHRVGHAGERDVSLDKRAPEQLGEGDGDFPLHHPVDPELPGRRVHLGQQQGGVDPVEGVVRRDERAEAGNVQVAACGERWSRHGRPGETQRSPRQGDTAPGGQLASGDRAGHRGGRGYPAADQEPPPCGPAGRPLVVRVGKKGEGGARPGFGSGRGNRQVWRGQRFRLGPVRARARLRTGAGRGRAQPSRRVGQPGQRERPGRRAGQGRPEVIRRGAGPGQGGPQADEGEQPEPPHAEREPARRHDADHRGVHGEYHQDAAEQHGLVRRAERGDGEVLDRQRSEVDGGLADREHRRAGRRGEPGDELRHADRYGRSEHACHGSGQGTRSPGLVTDGGGRWSHGGITRVGALPSYPPRGVSLAPRSLRPYYPSSSKVQRVGEPAKSPARMLNTRRGRTPMVAFLAGSRKSTR